MLGASGWGVGAKNQSPQKKLLLQQQQQVFKEGPCPLSVIVVFLNTYQSGTNAGVREPSNHQAAML